MEDAFDRVVCLLFRDKVESSVRRISEVYEIDGAGCSQCERNIASMNAYLTLLCRLATALLTREKSKMYKVEELKAGARRIKGEMEQLRRKEELVWEVECLRQRNPARPEKDAATSTVGARGETEGNISPPQVGVDPDLLRAIDAIVDG